MPAGVVNELADLTTTGGSSRQRIPASGRRACISADNQLAQPAPTSITTKEKSLRSDHEMSQPQAIVVRSDEGRTYQQGPSLFKAAGDETGGRFDFFEMDDRIPDRSRPALPLRSGRHLLRPGRSAGRPVRRRSRGTGPRRLLQHAAGCATHFRQHPQGPTSCQGDQPDDPRRIRRSYSRRTKRLTKMRIRLCAIKSTPTTRCRSSGRR